MKEKGKETARVAPEPSSNPRDPRKAGKAGKTGKGGAKRQARAPKTQADRRETQPELVDSPYGRAHGMDRVERIVDTIAAMHRRRQIDIRQRSAADMYRNAFETCPGSIRCALDVSPRAGVPGTASPTDDQLWAAGVLREAAAVLGQIDGAVVRRIVGEGQSVEDAAREAFQSEGRQMREHVGMRLRIALTQLADHWWPEKADRSHIRAVRGEGAEMAAEGAPFRRAVEATPVAHASSAGVRVGRKGVDNPRG
ncbi:hypothetical protein SAMN05216548_10419 [Faunimonas pinastri]|uniref:Uncharacterized protein n=1 Tax=Faunimonas pinastri TaxID=1855383 RepID=A0A1H9F8H9_9HYPH|nr:hypothetical protein [Faunimonas pinastri]SEQ33588.1 hypothetical protein SAMN05216548_10419 [Faunimonas pinastri]